jgi:tyrosine-protein phosphatase SIW14
MAAIAFGGYYGFWRYHLKRYQEVDEGVFYRVAQPTEFGLRHLVERRGIKTVVSLQLYDFRLYSGWLDPGDPNGAKEADYVRALGLRFVQWPMGEEQCWPWPTPWQLDEFIRLVDDPTNHPIMIHCMGGRHRTGTLSALYRIEYDRWTAERALEEMYSFDFGLPVPIHEWNIRTYVPRPVPTAAEWESLRKGIAGAAPAPFDAPAAVVGESSPAAATGRYSDLVRTLRAHRDEPAVIGAIGDYLRGGNPFALSLAFRVIDSPSHPLAPIAVKAASLRLQSETNDPIELQSAAAIIADFGGPMEQQDLLQRLTAEREKPARYEALVLGVLNRYTPNRIPLLRPLLDDTRPRPVAGLEGLRYCDTAFVRLAAITDDLPVSSWPLESMRDHGRDTAVKWLDAHQEATKLSQLLPPIGNKVVMAGVAPLEEDLSRMRK